MPSTIVYKCKYGQIVYYVYDNLTKLCFILNKKATAKNIKDIKSVLSDFAIKYNPNIITIDAFDSKDSDVINKQLYNIYDELKRIS